jgi:calcium-dependent protein kinase
LQKIDHPNVLKLYEYFEDSQNFYLVTELCLGGELYEKIVENEFFTEHQAACIFKQILISVCHLHKHNICHRDLKPENFMIVSKTDDLLNAQVKTIDFGLSEICCSQDSGKVEKMKTKVGTPYYMSPDVLSGSYSLSCDIWSAGCILYIMLCGYPPFNGGSDNEIYKNIKKGDLRFDEDEWSEISKDAKDLIKKIITKPEKRLTA